MVASWRFLTYEANQLDRGAMSDRAIFVVGGLSAVITLSALVMMVGVVWP